MRGPGLARFDRRTLSDEIRPIMRKPLRLTWALLLVAAGLATARAADVPTPESHLGYKPGADFHLADWPTVVDYFRKVDIASDRVVVQEIGKTTEGRPLLAAIVSGEATIRDLDRFKKLQKALADPGDDAEANRWAVLESKPVVLITCSIHSTETASTLMALELLHGLATGNDPATREVLDNTILILVPSINPDGVDKVANWYERTKGKPWEGDGMPMLYHYYAGHDTNRDWFMLNLKETQHLTRLLYKEWFPTILYDVHQMGSRGARLFVPPFYDPINPNVDPRINQGIFQIGAHMAADLASAGKRGVLTNAMYDNWMSGGNRTTTHRHNIVAVLTEAASVKLASPIYLDKSELKGVTRGFTGHEPSVNFVDPWPGGWWRLRDIVDYELICARSILSLAARYRGQFQANYQRLGREAIRKGRDEPPLRLGRARRPARSRDRLEARRNPPGLGDQGPPGPLVVHRRWSRLPGRKLDLARRAAVPGPPQGHDGAPAVPQPPRAQRPGRGPLRRGRLDPPAPDGREGRRAVGHPLRASSTSPTASSRPGAGSKGTASPTFFAVENRANDDFRVLNALLAAGVEVKAARQARDDRARSNCPPGRSSSRPRPRPGPCSNG